MHKREDLLPKFYSYNFSTRLKFNRVNLFLKFLYENNKIQKLFLHTS